MQDGSIATRCIAARGRLGISQEELARRAGVSRDVIAMIETGRSERPRKIAEIAKALEVSPAWLQFGNPDIDKLSAETIEAALTLEAMSPDVRAALLAAIEAASKK